VANLRAQLEALNSITFSDAEWERFFTACIAEARRRQHKERVPHRQAEHPQQPPAGHQPVRVQGGEAGAPRQPLRRDDSGQRPAMVHVELKRAAWTSARPSTRSTATSGTASGPARGCSSTCSCSSSATARSPSTTATPRATASEEQRGATRQEQDLQQLRVHSRGGPTQQTGRSPTWWLRQDLFRQAHAAEYSHPLLRVRPWTASCW
jgi:hypothetical protein